MSDDFNPGDLITGRPIVDNTLLFADLGVDLIAEANSLVSLMARPAGTVYWTLRVPRCSIMTVVEAEAYAKAHGGRVVTALHDGQLIEVFLSDIKLLDVTEQ